MKTSADKAAGGLTETFWRTLLTFSVTRVLITILLLIYVGVDVSQHQIQSAFNPVLLCTGGYAALAFLFFCAAAIVPRRLRRQLLLQITIDLLFISLLYVTNQGERSGIGILYLLPLAGGAILLNLLLALFFTSIATIVMVSSAIFRTLYATETVSTLQPAVYAIAFFVTVILLNSLARHLLRQEDLARQRGEDLGVQREINRLAMMDMSDGIVVLDYNARLYSINPAGERMLGIQLRSEPGVAMLSSLPAMEPIIEAFENWRHGQAEQKTDLHAAPSAPSAPYYVTLGAPGEGDRSVSAEWNGRHDGQSRLSIRFVCVDQALRGRPLCPVHVVSADGAELPPDPIDLEVQYQRDYRAVLFMQDLGEIENQAQQLKLAAMGRLTASIAHEVRNPLSSISYAATLLMEEAQQPAEVRLLNIISDNVTRLNRMIEDILNLSRKSQRPATPVSLSAMTRQVVAEFRQTHDIADEMLDIDIESLSDDAVRFDPLHFHEVVTNLLSNAVRYASGKPGAIRVQLTRGQGRQLELHVQDDGKPISPEVRSHLFEPFYTTSSKGTGLGLFLARELCANNGAKLDYEYRQDDRHPAHIQLRGRFVVSFVSNADDNADHEAATVFQNTLTGLRLAVQDGGRA